MWQINDDDDDDEEEEEMSNYFFYLNNAQINTFNLLIKWCSIGSSY